VPTVSIGFVMARQGRELGFSDFVMEKVAVVNERSLDAIVRLKQAGVRLGLGTDLVGGLDRFQYEELQVRREVWSAADVLRSATSVNAEIVRRPDIGRIEPGLIADIIVVNGNPL